MFDLRWSLLRGALFTLVITVAVSVVLVLISTNYAAQKKAGYLQQHARLGEVGALFRSAQNDRTLYSRYVSVYENLENRGVIGDEPRLRWVEALERINQVLELPVLRYEIQPQRLLAMQGNRRNEGAVRIYRSSMSLDVRLFHEGDLLGLLHELRRRTSGRFAVRDCEIKSLATRRAYVLDARQPNLAALCNLDWYTLQIGTQTERSERAS